MIPKDDLYKSIYVYERLVMNMSSIKNNIAVDELSYKEVDITSIRTLSENTKVYNLEVANDNSYTVNHYIVHNCDDP